MSPLIEELTADEITLHESTKVKRVDTELASYLESLPVGAGGRIDMTREPGNGASRQTWKNRLNTAAKYVGIAIKFSRSPGSEVIFKRVEADTDKG